MIIALLYIYLLSKNRRKGCLLLLTIKHEISVLFKNQSHCYLKKLNCFTFCTFCFLQVDLTLRRGSGN